MQRHYLPQCAYRLKTRSRAKAGAANSGEGTGAAGACAALGAAAKRTEAVGKGFADVGAEAAGQEAANRRLNKVCKARVKDFAGAGVMAERAQGKMLTMANRGADSMHFEVVGEAAKGADLAVLLVEALVVDRGVVLAISTRWSD